MTVAPEIQTQYDMDIQTSWPLWRKRFGLDYQPLFFATDSSKCGRGSCLVELLFDLAVLWSETRVAHLSPEDSEDLYDLSV